MKNLENVQGDERDHMVLSVGYGPTTAGAVPNRFGPINQEGGERRLNVAVTRARQSMTVVHSLRAEDITSMSLGARQLRRYLEYVRNPEQALEAAVSGVGEPESAFEEAVLATLRERGHHSLRAEDITSMSLGARQLRRYLEYVRNPEQALEAAVSGVGEPESAFEEAVLATLRERGHRAEAQVGVSGYRLDLAIKSEDGGRFDLGIECDGATYHRSPAVRDRDWLRQQVLEGLGWHIHRVWSTAWIRDRETEIRAIEGALDRARRKDPLEHKRTSGKSTSESQPPTGPGDTDNALPAPQPFRPAQLFDPYPRFAGKRRRGKVRNALLAHVAKLVREIVAVEQPVHVNLVINHVVTLYDDAKAGKKIRQHIEGAIEQAIVYRTVGREGTDGLFLRLAGNTELPRPRRARGRTIDLIAEAELDRGVLLIARKTFGAPQPDLVRETARQFGYKKVGPKIKTRLNQRVERLIDNGQLLRRGDMLIATPDDGTT